MMLDDDDDEGTFLNWLLIWINYFKSSEIRKISKIMLVAYESENLLLGQHLFYYFIIS